MNPVTEIGSIAESFVGGLFDLRPTANDIHEENPQFPKPIKKKKQQGGGFCKINLELSANIPLVLYQRFVVERRKSFGFQ